MKLPRLLIFSGLVLGQGLTAALAQTDNDSRRVPATVVASPFQALGNVIRNPDAEPPRRRAAPVTRQSPTQPSPPTIIPPDTLENGASVNPDAR
jgi:hypothetical protein